MAPGTTPVTDHSAILEIPLPDKPGKIDATALFGSRRMVEVDAGSGKGRFLLARAAAFPETGFIGIERQHRRVEKITRKATRAGLGNIRILHTDIRFALEMMVPDNAIRTLYLFFPDPWPKRRHQCRRLVTRDFIRLVHAKLEPGGCLHFATDHEGYATAVKALFEISPGFTPCDPFIPTPGEQTDFELLFADRGLAPRRLSLQKTAGAAPPIKDASDDW